MARFISQFSFLKWRNPNLYLEVNNRTEANEIEALLTPRLTQRNSDSGAEILELGEAFSESKMGELTTNRVISIDTEFVEGQKTRIIHLRTERSVKLKEFYFSSMANPHICDMCAMDTQKRYPWTNHIIELHHLLPLCSPARVEQAKTSIKDIAGICPSCHRATHKYYGIWLRSNRLRDFRSDEEARAVYAQAKQEIVLR